jgi:hypothetical protein
MITFAFRVILIVASLASLGGILIRIRNSKVRIEDSLFWLFFALLCIVLAVWPHIADSISQLLGIYQSQNFVFLLFIFILVVKVFSLTIQTSSLEGKVRKLTQELAILKHETMLANGELGKRHPDVDDGEDHPGSGSGSAD